MTQGQILPGSVFGDLLTKYAREAETIVELGTMSGQGSTLCLWRGMSGTAKMWTVEIDPETCMKAGDAWKMTDKIQFLCGRVSDVFDEFDHPDGEPARKTMGYDFCKSQFFKAPNVIDQLPPSISLLLIDSGEFSASGELHALINRCKVIALDDTNPDKAHKNVDGRLRLIHRGWTVLHDNQADRNGYFIATRPA